MEALIELSKLAFWNLLPHLTIATLGGVVLLGLSRGLNFRSSGKQQAILWSGLICFILPLPWITSKLIEQLPEEPNRLINFSAFDFFINPEFHASSSGSVERLASVGGNLDLISFGLVFVPLLVWLLGAVICLTTLVVRSVICSYRLQKMGVKMENKFQQRIDYLALEMDLYSPITGYWMPQDSWLGVMGIFHSRIMIPRGLNKSLSSEEFDSLLLHELGHVKRRDNLRRWFQSIIVSIFWFHPVVRVIHQSLIWESERACDELVLEHGMSKSRYERGLLKSVRYSLDLSLSGSSGMSRFNLNERLSILQNYQQTERSAFNRVLFAGGLLLVYSALSVVAAQGSLTSAAVKYFSLEEGEFLMEVDQVALESDGRKFTSVNDYISERSEMGYSPSFFAAVCSYNLGDFEKAVFYVGKTTRKFPECAEANLLAGYANMHLENFEKAGAYFTTALQINDRMGDSALHGALAYCQLRSEDYGSARISFEEALAGDVISDKNRVNYLRGLAKSYWKIGDKAEARETFKDLLGEDPFFRDYYLAILNGDAPSLYLNI